MADRTSPVILVHGAWHGPWCWDRVTPLLDARGIEWQALDLPSMQREIDHVTDLHCDAAALRDALDGLDRPAVVVGHSYGGMVITEGAAGHPNARHLVYLAAFMPDAAESLNGLMGQAPNPAFIAGLRVDDERRMALAPEVVGPVLYGDCDEATGRWASQHLRSMQSAGSEAARAAAWHDVPSTYVICARDAAILPELQRSMAKRATNVVEWETSHSPFASRPELVADLLVSLAAAD